MRSFRSGRVAAALALLALAGCDQKKPSASAAPSAAQPDVAEPSTTPSDAEVFSAFLAYWKAAASGQITPRDDAYNLLTPVGAEQLAGGVTSDTPYGKQRDVSVSYSFRTNGPLSYACTGGLGRMIWVSAAGSAAQDTFPNAASAGAVISCTIPAVFNKVDEGWVLHPNRDDPAGYVIKR